MKSRIHEIAIRNFKAFREFNLNLEGRHLLVYGANGSGKSSLYWALYTFLESARKLDADVSKYFDAAQAQNLLNIHEQTEPIPRDAKIALTFRDSDMLTDTTYRITKDNHGTRNKPDILKANLASDFITYRFFFGFADFKNSERFNLWRLFEKEILPFCVSTGGGTPVDMWDAIKHENPNPHAETGRTGANAYEEFRTKTDAFAAILPGIVDSISDKAQQFYDEHFSQGDPAKVTLKLGLTTPPSFTGSNQNDAEFTPPFLEFGIQVDGNTISRPQSFLNEAKLTQLALAVRFAASLVNLHDSDIKLLVLDDLLVSLDMSNRMKVVEILLAPTFENYQKIILTHDLGFFREFHRKLGANHAQWMCVSLNGAPKDVAIETEIEKDNIAKAEEYLQGFRLDEAALTLRKAVEDTAKRFNNGDGEVVPTKSFTTLSNELQAARSRLISQLPVKLYDQILKRIPADQLQHLVTADTADIDALAIPVEEKHLLKAKRRELRRLVSEDSLKVLKKVALVEKIDACRERVLNPAAHLGFYPLYFHEVQEALRLIRELDNSVV